jgi:hypothetical protein
MFPNEGEQKHLAGDINISGLAKEGWFEGRY